MNPTATPNPQQRLFAQLTSFLSPITSAAGLKLKPFSINFFSMTRLAGLHVGGKEFGGLSAEAKEQELAALLVMLTTEDAAALGKALRAANGDFQIFYWEYVFPLARDITAEGLAAAEEVLVAEMPAIDAATVEVRTPPERKSGEKTPPN